MTSHSHSRNLVRSGLIDQRDRATKRRRFHASDSVPESDLFDVLSDFACRFLGQLGDAHRGSISTDRYLEFVGMPNVPIDERLRLLAIELERRDYPWPVVDQVYREALRHPADIVVFESRAISAHRGGFTDDRARSAELGIITAGAFLMPDDPIWDYQLGIYHYDGKRDPENALQPSHRTRTPRWLDDVVPRSLSA